MVLGLYYITKPRKGVKGEGLVFYSAEEAIIANNEGRADLHAQVKVRMQLPGAERPELVETTVGRILFNQFVPRRSAT